MSAFSKLVEGLMKSSIRGVCKRKGCENETLGSAEECPNCWEVRFRLESFLKSSENWIWAKQKLRENATQPCPRSDGTIVQDELPLGECDV